MTEGSETPAPSWTAALQPARVRERRADLESVAETPTDLVGVPELAAELRALRATVEERTRALSFRVDAIATDLLRLVALLRDSGRPSE